MKARTKGFLQFTGAGLVFLLAIYWLMDQRADDPNYILPGGHFGLIALVTPGGFSLAGLIQLISGVPFPELSDKWNSLKGWQRGIYGLLIVAAAFGAVIGGFMLYVFGTAS